MAYNLLNCLTISPASAPVFRVVGTVLALSANGKDGASAAIDDFRGAAFRLNSSSLSFNYTGSGGIYSGLERVQDIFFANTIPKRRFVELNDKAHKENIA